MLAYLSLSGAKRLGGETTQGKRKSGRNDLRGEQESGRNDLNEVKVATKRVPEVTNWVRND